MQGVNEIQISLPPAPGAVISWAGVQESPSCWIPWYLVSLDGQAAFRAHLGLIYQPGADFPRISSSPAPAPGEAFGLPMFPPRGGRRTFPREPGPWQAGPRLPLHHEPPWEHQHRRGRGGWRPPCPWGPRPFPGPENFYENEEEDRRWAPHDFPPPPPWHDERDIHEPEDWHSPAPLDPRPFPGPDNFYGHEKEETWAPNNSPPPPPWDDRENFREPEGSFGEFWHPNPRLPSPDCFDRCEFPMEEQHPPWPPASMPGEPGGFQDDCPPLGYRGLPGRRYRRLRRDHRDVIVVQRLPCSPRPSRGTRPPPRSAPPRSPPRSRRSQPVIKEEPQNPDPSQPLLLKDGAQRREETAQVVGFLPHLVPATTSETSLHRLSPARCRPVTNQPGFPQGPPVGQGEFPKAPRPADTPQKSPAADSQAAREAVEPEQAAGATPVEPGAEQTPVDSKDPSALEIEPVPPEESSAGPGEHHEVEPRSPSVPRAGAGGRSRSQIPAATPEPAERVHVVSISRREVGVELCPPSQGQQCQLSGAGDAEAEASKHGLLSNLQPTQNSLGATAEPDVEPSQASSNVCTKPDTSPGTQHPPGSGDTELAAGGRPWLCSALPTPVPAGTDLRSAAVLARKEEIELSYQQFSLTIAVVATMLLAKEPSMEAALGLALRANLRQGRIHHLQELEDFINSYDSATLSP
ncbi:histone-lysine N-methyltransferase 2D-like isoform X2 [Apus apus]|uniref:histone-lysine N-methyltransferase 2D-like isoform X2 n=1 Tax=Apus apus TaxID=8895 RepID=UPI0021F87193|nr:histone-lysine N-methyltransferase 2D-like isoform X2 [Apus apus]